MQDARYYRAQAQIYLNLAQRLTHPSTKMRKTYIVTLDREFDFALGPKMKKGVAIEEGCARMEDIYRVGPRTLLFAGIPIIVAAKLRRSEGSISRVASELGIHVYSRRSLIKMAQEKSAQA